RLEALLGESCQRGFALDQAPLLRLDMVRLDGGGYRLVVAHHHLLLDGWSLSLLLGELRATYLALRGGVEPALRPVRPYRDHIEWLLRQDPAAAATFWREELAGFREPTRLGVERAAGDEGPPGHAEHQVALSPALSAALTAFAHRHQLTLNTIVQGAWATLLSRYSGQDEVVFGATVSGRPAELDGVEAMVGMFINTLPLRVRVPVAEPLVSWLRGLQAHNAKLRQHEHASLVEVQGASGVPRGVPLFDTIVVFENQPVDASLREEGGPLVFRDFRIIEHTNYPITVVVKPGPTLGLFLSYDRQRLGEATVERMGRHLRRLLESAVEGPGQRVGELEMPGAEERRELVVGWNATRAGYPRERTVVELFEEQARRAPGARAAVFEGEALTYAELNGRANQLARRLRELGAGPERVVGLCVERSLELVVGVMGVLKAGAAYLPLDPSYPQERLRFMVEDAGVELLVTGAGQASALGFDEGRVVRLGEEALCGLGREDLPRQAGPEHLAYVIYTSGSTGRPKGVGLEHRGLCNLAAAQAAAFGLGAQSRVLQVASLSFDASVWEVVMALTRGASLHLVKQEVLLSTEELCGAIEREGITTATFPPSLLGTLPAERLAGRLGTVVVAGEAFPRELAVRWAPGRRLFNAYGPSETTVCATIHRCSGEEASSPPIGRPIANTQVYVLDGRLEPVPVGVAGELYIGGEGVARGYLKRPGLTAERFVPDPFGEAGGRLYRTGDLARRRADGCVEFLGRLDHQVKVRGFRVELGEIETALGQHARVREAVVVARGDGPGEKQLVAYTVGEATAGELRAHLRDRLPEYMVPSAFVALAAMPLSPNGKVDRKALPAPERGRGREYQAPRTETEKALAEIWARVLGVERVGLQDNFFELGGDSILSIQVIAQARQRGLRLSPRQLFEHQTVEALAAVAVAGERVEAEQGLVTGRLPLTPIQAWFFEQELAEPHHFNQSVVLEVEAGFRWELLGPAMERLLAHHDALRLRFARREGRWEQEIAERDGHEVVERVEVAGLSEGERRRVLEARGEALQGSLSLEQGPLVRVAYFDAGPGERGRLLLVVHHLAVDGVSWR
ncbi:MAG TPA: amino acid adenylation domain-containing protein, partial [Myxococcaceae bacterium]|nr:amino acid adenylation domain-containing protein [Myxococcaceae bacterium]